MPFTAIFRVLVALFLLSSCTGSDFGPSSVEVALHSGIKGLVVIGDSEEDVMKNKKSEPVRTEIGKAIDGVEFSHMLHFKDQGLRVYFKRSRVVLIEMQEPFKGTIQGRNLKLFTFGTPPDKSWEAALLREFGSPLTRTSGGRMNSQGMFYSWGDVSFNNNGANELAIYRDPEIAKFRQKNFGRNISFFSR